MNAAVGEIKKLNEQLSQLRQENIVLKVSLSSPVETIAGVLEGLFPHHRILVDTSSSEKIRLEGRARFIKILTMPTLSGTTFRFNENLSITRKTRNPCELS